MCDKMQISGLQPRTAISYESQESAAGSTVKGKHTALDIKVKSRCEFPTHHARKLKPHNLAAP